MCEWCESKSTNLTEFTYYITPFYDTTPEIVQLCETCLDNIDNIMFCDTCNRYILYNQGYRINLRYNSEIEGFECMECLQKEWLNKGMENFKSADFFDYRDLSDNGFENSASFFCRSESDYKIVENEFTELQQTNYVIANIDSSGHIEHHISLYVKKKE